MIRLLLVRNSSTEDRLVQTILDSDPALTVVGRAGDGEEAARMCGLVNPDVIVTGSGVSNREGDELIVTIRKKTPRPIIVLSSTESASGRAAFRRAAGAGALRVLLQPHGLPGKDQEAETLIRAVRTLASVKVVRRPWSRQASGTSGGVRRATTTAPRQRPEVALIAIGASTGGPPALRAVLGALPAGFPAPLVIVQHLSRGFIEGMARWLNDGLPLRVKVAEHGEVLAAGTVYLAPDDRHLHVFPRCVLLDSRTGRVDGHRPSATVLFESAVAAHGSRCVGVLLTGMGADGARGLKALHHAGAPTFAQNKQTCVVFGMPRVAIEMDAAEEVLPPLGIAKRLIELTAKKETIL